MESVIVFELTQNKPFARRKINAKYPMHDVSDPIEQRFDTNNPVAYLPACIIAIVAQAWLRSFLTVPR